MLRRSTRTAVAATTLLLGACADRVVDPTGVAGPRGPALTKDHAEQSVTYFGATCGGGDDTQAFQAAVNRAAIVNVPGCDFHLNGTVFVPSNTTLRGVGLASRLIFSDINVRRVIWVHDPADAPVSDVVVEGLHVQLNAPGPKPPGDRRFAFGARRGTRVQFRNNYVTGTNGLLVEQSGGGVQVLNNVINGGGVQDSSSFGILVFGYNFGGVFDPTTNVLVKKNQVENYGNGIQWFGGVADPDSAGFTRVPAVSDVVIDSNTVRNVNTGIWGSNGNNITVSSNTVSHCGDMCLDAEGSSDVRFVGNKASFAGASVLGSYFFSTRIVFDSNTVIQNGSSNGTMWNTPAGQEPDSLWTRMFWTVNKRGTEDIDLEVRRNHFLYQGSGPTVGLVQKRPSRNFVFDGNVLSETVVEIASLGSGNVEISNNEVYLTRHLYRPAISAGGNTISRAPGGYPGVLKINGNIIRGPESTGSLGVRVVQADVPRSIYTYIENNDIRGFSTSIWASGATTLSSHPFRIVWNVVDGAILTRHSPYDEVHSNFYLGGSGGGSDPDPNPDDPTCGNGQDFC